MVLVLNALMLPLGYLIAAIIDRRGFNKIYMFVFIFGAVLVMMSIVA